jgi:hypothetical protein
VTAHTEALARLVEQGYPLEQARAIVDYFGAAAVEEYTASRDPVPAVTARCFGTWDDVGANREMRCERPLGHDGACLASGMAFQLGRNIVANLDGPSTATSTPQHRAEPCVTCQGTGWVPDPKLPHTRNEPCRDCNGTGVAP